MSEPVLEHAQQQQEEDDVDHGLKMRGGFVREAVYTNRDGTMTKQPEYRVEWAKGQMVKKRRADGKTRFQIGNLTPVNFARVFLLFALNWVGLFVAGAIMSALESGQERDVRARAFQELDDARAGVAALVLESSSAATNRSNANANADAIAWANLNATQLQILERYAAAVVAEPSANARWKYWESVYFSLSVATTIGYGAITPVTTGGRVFVMFYAVFGVGKATWVCYSHTVT